jgi:hypothetical protein
MSRCLHIKSSVGYAETVSTGQSARGWVIREAMAVIQDAKSPGASLQVYEQMQVQEILIGHIKHQQCSSRLDGIANSYTDMIQKISMA